jgi:hypothetical protein
LKRRGAGSSRFELTNAENEQEVGGDKRLDKQLAIEALYI